MRDVNPLLENGSLVPWCAPLDAPIVIRQGDTEIARLEPINGAARPTALLCLELYGLAIESIGIDDDGTEVFEEHLNEADAAAREILRHRPEVSGLIKYTFADRVFDLFAVSAMRSLGASFSHCAQVIGRPVVAGKRLVAPGSRARELEASQKAENERIEAEAQAAQRAFTEANRIESRTLRDSDFVGIRILDEPGVTIPRELATATMIGGTIVFWAIPGLPLPRVVFAVGEILAPQHVITANAQMLASVGLPDTESYGLVCRILQRHVPGRKTGPVEAFSKQHTDAAREFVREWATYLYQVRTALGWMPRHIVEVCVRGYLISPPAAVALIWSELLDQERMSAHRQILAQAGAIGTTHPPIRILQDPNMQQIDKIDLRVTRPVDRPTAEIRRKTS